MPVTRTAAAQEPKRQRGHLRVAAILEAGIAVFSEKGYDAATMTEIAARSETAIGSLYRFFPSKEALADALLLRYAEHVTGKLEALAQRASSMAQDELADELVDFMLSLDSQRGFTAALLDARGGSDVRRAKFRQATREGLGRVLRAATPALPKAKAETVAAVLLHVLKGLHAIEVDKPAARRLLQAEIRLLVRVYLESAQKSA
jgi:AcrR family transcriptional regulator